MWGWMEEKEKHVRTECSFFYFIKSVTFTGTLHICFSFPQCFKGVNCACNTSWCFTICWHLLQHSPEVLTSFIKSMQYWLRFWSLVYFWVSSQQLLPVASHVALWPAIHVRGTLESSVSLALLQHWGLRVGHAGRKQGTLWCAGTSKARVCLLVYTCDGRSRTGQPHWNLQTPSFKSTYWEEECNWC